MAKKRGSVLRTIGAAARLAAVAGVVYFKAVRPWHTNWGATPEEVAMPLPGDELIPQPGYVSNHAVTVNAPIADVWPWLVQIGYQRAGWYSYDSLHSAMKVAGSVDDPERSADRIIPELQNLKVGDTIRIQPAEEMSFTVLALDPPRTLLMGTGKDEFKVDPMMGGMTWAWVLQEVDADTTRFIVRTRNVYSENPVVRVLYKTIIDPGGFIMERRTMLNIKARAEAAVRGDRVDDACCTNVACCG
ncbi:MAG: hypothetical protein ACYC5O_00245 [Anaerolineae bacterium]